MRTALILLLVLALSSVACWGRKGRTGAALVGLAARAVVAVAAAAAAAAASRRADVPPQPPVVAPDGVAVAGPAGSTLIPALGGVASCPAAPAVEVQGCLQPGIFRPHDSWSACAYFCLDHCEYHGAAAATVRPLSPEEAAALVPRRAPIPAAPPPIPATPTAPTPQAPPTSS
jgi:hypothetical protein